MKLENALKIIHGFRIIAFLAGVRSTPCKTENLTYQTMIGENSHTCSHGKSLSFHKFLQSRMFISLSATSGRNHFLAKV